MEIIEERINSSYDPDYEYAVDLILQTTVIMDQVLVKVSDNGQFWDYLDRTFKWAQPYPNEDNYIEEKYGIKVDDKYGVAEKCDDLINEFVPEYDGIYELSGTFKLVYTVEDILSGRDYFEDYDGSYEYFEDVNAEYCEIEYQESDSSVSNFQAFQVN